MVGSQRALVAPPEQMWGLSFSALLGIAESLCPRFSDAGQPRVQHVTPPSCLKARKSDFKRGKPGMVSRPLDSLLS